MRSKKEKKQTLNSQARNSSTRAQLTSPLAKTWHCAAFYTGRKALLPPTRRLPPPPPKKPKPITITVQIFKGEEKEITPF